MVKIGHSRALVSLGRTIPVCVFTAPAVRIDMSLNDASTPDPVGRTASTRGVRRLPDAKLQGRVRWFLVRVRAGVQAGSTHREGPGSSVWDERGRTRGGAFAYIGFVGETWEWRWKLKVRSGKGNGSADQGRRFWNARYMLSLTFFFFFLPRPFQTHTLSRPYPDPSRPYPETQDSGHMVACYG